MYVHAFACMFGTRPKTECLASFDSMVRVWGSGERGWSGRACICVYVWDKAED